MKHPLGLYNPWDSHRPGTRDTVGSGPKRGRAGLHDELEAIPLDSLCFERSAPVPEDEGKE